MNTTLHPSSETIFNSITHSTTPIKETVSSLYDTYAPAVYGVLIKWVKNENTAQDLLQQAFQLYAKEVLFVQREDKKPLINLLQIARRECDMYYKNKSSSKTKFREFSSVRFAASL